MPIGVALGKSICWCHMSTFLTLEFLAANRTLAKISITGSQMTAKSVLGCLMIRELSYNFRIRHFTFGSGGQA